MGKGHLIQMLFPSKSINDTEDDAEYVEKWTHDPCWHDHIVLEKMNALTDVGNISSTKGSTNKDGNSAMDVWDDIFTQAYRSRYSRTEKENQHRNDAPMNDESSEDDCSSNHTLPTEDISSTCIDKGNLETFSKL